MAALGPRASPKVRVRGRGFPGAQGSEPGDLFAELRVVVPEKINERERKLYEQLREASNGRDFLAQVRCALTTGVGAWDPYRSPATT